MYLPKRQPQRADKDKGIAIGNTGTVKLKLWPSWFRWDGKKPHTTVSGWYPAGKGTSAPTGEQRWLAVTQNSAKLHTGELYNINFGQAAADVYLVGRTTGTPVYDDSDKTLTVTPTKQNDFAWFPDAGGLIGLVRRSPDDAAFPADAAIDTVRFTYDRKTFDGTHYVFTNVTPLASGSVSFANKDIALGQYFRILSEGTTGNGARAALIWHANGKNSLRRENGGGADSVVIGGSTADDLTDAFGGKPDAKDDDLIVGDNIIGNLESDDGQLEWEFDGINGANKYGIERNHFLKKGNVNGNQEYWYAAVASRWLAYTISPESGKPSLSTKIQYSFRPDDTDDDYFTGVMFRLGFLTATNTISSEGNVQQGHGAKGLGVGIVQGAVQLDNNKNTVKTASINPALLPGFTHTENGKFELSEDKYYRGDPGGSVSLGTMVTEHNKHSIKLHPLLILWTFDVYPITTP